MFNKNEFKKLLLKLYYNYPDVSVEDIKLKTIFKKQEVIDRLVNDSVLRSEIIYIDDNCKIYYTLGFNGLNLVESWKNDFLTLIMLILMWYSFLTTLLFSINVPSWIIFCYFLLILIIITYLFLSKNQLLIQTFENSFFHF